jgi:hypothetical protein
MNVQEIIEIGDHRFASLKLSVYLSIISGLGVPLLSILSDGDSNLTMPLTIISIAAALLSIPLGAGAIMDIAQLSKDMDPDYAATNFGKAFAKAPFAVFTILSVLFPIAIAVADIMYLNA